MAKAYWVQTYRSPAKNNEAWEAIASSPHLH